LGNQRRRVQRHPTDDAPRAESAFATSLRPFANRLFVFGLSEWSLVVLLGATWISPEFVENLRPGFLAGLPMLFVTEFIFSHAAGAMGVSAKFKGIGKWLFVVFLVLIYGMWFVLLVQWGYGIQAAFFLWLTAGRIYRAESSFRPSGRGDEARERMAADLALPAVLRFFFLILCLLVSQALPLPQLGLAHYHPTAGSGALMDRPERMVFLLMLYFTSIPWMERHVFPKVVRVFNP
jgi:hypothetical protein